MSNNICKVRPTVYAFPFNIATITSTNIRTPRELLCYKIGRELFIGTGVGSGHTSFTGARRVLSTYNSETVKLGICFSGAISRIESVAPVYRAITFTRTRKLSVVIRSSGPPIPVGRLLRELHYNSVLARTCRNNIGGISRSSFTSLGRTRTHNIVVSTNVTKRIRASFTIFETTVTTNTLPSVVDASVAEGDTCGHNNECNLAVYVDVTHSLKVDRNSVFETIADSTTGTVNVRVRYKELRINEYTSIYILSCTSRKCRLASGTNGAIGDRANCHGILAVISKRLICEEWSRLEVSG